MWNRSVRGLAYAAALPLNSIPFLSRGISLSEAEVIKQFLVVSAVGTDRPGMVNDLSRAILDCGCNIEDSRLAVLGREFALIALISGNWSAIARMEAGASSIEKRLGLALALKRTQGRIGQDRMLPYVVDVVALDRPGIVHDVADFFASREINVEDMSSWVYAAAHTRTPMFSLNMTVSVPADLHIGQLRDEFTDFCDELNLDATMEPARR